MTWKRCEGCTRAISTAALTCEYCGRPCDTGPTSLPADPSDQAPFAWPLEDPQSGSTTGYITDDSPQGLPGLELNASFPFTEVDNEPDDAALLTPDEPASAPHLGPPAPEAPPAPVAAAPAKQSVGPRQMAMLGGALVAASALIFTILSMRPSASPEPSAQAGPPAPGRRPVANRAPSGASRPAGAPASAPLTSKWSEVTGGRWTGGNKKSVAFELRANNRIHIWTRDVTPLLIVRCQGGHVEPFVYTQSAARMEPQDGEQPVRGATDDGPEATERWPDSDEHDALFAKDGTAFVHQLTTAQTLRFGFEPHNAPPAVARFDVSGLSELLARSAKQCGSKR